MRLTSTFKKAPRLLVAAAAVSTLTVGAVALTGSPAFAGSLTSPTFSTSNGAANVSGTGNTATYTINFITSTSWVASATGSVTFTVPTGTTLSGAAVTAFGLGGCTIGTATQAVLTVTVQVQSCTVPINTPVSIAVSGFTNGTQITAFPSAIATNSATGTSVDTGNAAAVTFGSNQTIATVIVPDTLTFTNSATAVTLLAVPQIVATTTPVNLGISTNAKSGYTLQACDTAGALTGPTGPGPNTIPQSSNGAATALPTNGTSSAFGAYAVATHGTGGSGTFTLTTPWSGTTSSLFLGYNALCTAGAGSTVATETGPVSNDLLAITNGVGISNTQAAGTYTGTITYQVNPSY
jgi:hypothetical protein